MNIPHHPTNLQNSIFGKLPTMWAGTAAVDGDAAPWKDAACGSMYAYVTGGTAAVMYVKTADAPEDADWVNIVD